MQFRHRLALCVALAATVLATAASPARGADPVIAAAGDIACAPTDPSFNGGSGSSTRCGQRQTSNLLVNAGLSAVLPLGDNQYENSTLVELQGSYNPTWGRVKAVTRPVVGNHETSNGHWDYFNGAGASNGAAGPRGTGWYSFNLGAWHIVALNSNCAWLDGGCVTGSPQEQWLRADLTANPAACTLAYWHHPLFSSKTPDAVTKPFWDDLYAAGADVVLNGHVHNYERFAPQTPNGRPDQANGIQEFVVGTGGMSLESSGGPAQNSAARVSDTFGVLKLRLRPTSYDWEFVAGNGTVRDSGTASCHFPAQAPPPSPPPPPRPAPKVTGVQCTIVGTEGNDDLAGTPRRDVICGLGGDDRLRGAGGKDLLAGGGGHDLIVGAGGRDVLFGGKGGDRLSGGAGKDRLFGGSGRDRLRGGGGNDRIVDGKGGDFVWGNSGADLVIASLQRRDKDFVDGGRGRDSASVNKRDRVRSVEHFLRVKRKRRSFSR